MMEEVDITDLKSVGHLAVRVQIPLGVQCSIGETGSTRRS